MMSWIRLPSPVLITAALWCTALSPVFAQTASESGSPDVQGFAPDSQNEYGGVVTNQTITSLGSFFHTRFSEGWSAQADADNYTLAVRERSSPRAGTEMLVYFGDLVVFRGNLPRNLPAITAMAESAAETAHANVVNFALQSLLFSDPDMASSGL